MNINSSSPTNMADIMSGRNINAEPKKEERGIMKKDDFMKLFLASLKYQDPMSPMETKDMMQQMNMLSQMEAIMNMSTIVDGLKDVVKGDPIEQGVNYLGKEITGMSENGKEVTGIVDEVQINGGKLELLVNNKSIEIGSISRVANHSAYAAYQDSNYSK